MDDVLKQALAAREAGEERREGFGEKDERKLRIKSKWDGTKEADRDGKRDKRCRDRP